MNGQIKACPGLFNPNRPATGRVCLPACMDPIDADLAQTAPRGNYLPYPASRLAPSIVPQDLTHFKSRGISQVERSLQQELVELRERYLAVIDAFNWNKLIYEAQFGFEPVIGATYHLYEVGGRHQLSMIEPESWHQRWIGSFRLNADGRWQVNRLAEDFDLRAWIEGSRADSA